MLFRVVGKTSYPKITKSTTKHGSEKVITDHGPAVAKGMYNFSITIYSSLIIQFCKEINELFEENTIENKRNNPTVYFILNEEKRLIMFSFFERRFFFDKTIPERFVITCTH